MNIFKNLTLKWWQTGLFKLALLAIGVAVGAYWSEVFLPYLNALIVIGVVAGGYIWYVWAQQ